MPAPRDIRAAALARGRLVKKRNALTAAIFGFSLAVIAAKVFSFTFIGFFGGIVVGLVYSNAFEYLLHRYLLHSPHGVFAKYHSIHHSTWGAPDEALYANFARDPWVVVLLFTVNAAPFIAVEWAFRAGLAPGVLVGFVIYFVAYEETHWRVHFGGWLPSWLQFARRHHLSHHAAAEERFNVFLPLFDWLVGGLRK
ncbi:MAG TPA: sterol desaturase family protein [Candidatus Acidoferrales bacterium]|jgi:hypothetical protein|nr:sterol desaturase family protein [Candidatus Acidoferrales bacterium]